MNKTLEKKAGMIGMCGMRAGKQASKHTKPTPTNIDE